jgi:hypothetical protein
MYGWKICCYTQAVECRQSAALLRFAVYISELVSCIISTLDLRTLKLFTLKFQSSCFHVRLAVSCYFLPVGADHFLSRLLKNVAVCQCCYLTVS